MRNEYANVITRFLRLDERLIVSKENEMPLVIEANGSTSVKFLKEFLTSHSVKILEDVAKYGALLFRGFDIASDEDFENTILSIPELRGISEAFMSEQGRTHVGNLKFVLHTNSVYKTGGTLYLGGFHSENYYNPDVPTYISFCCLKPSSLGGETGIINMEKVYEHLNNGLKEKLEKNSFFVSKWLVSDVAERYQISSETIEKICNQFDLPIIGKGNQQFILMYKPSIFVHPLTQKKSLQINFFKVPKINVEMRKCFIKDYKGKDWFWHRFIWRLPTFVFDIVEFFAVMFISFFHSPKESFSILRSKLKVYKASRKINNFNKTGVKSCFNNKEIKDITALLRDYYSSCIWKKGDILLVDNRKVTHAGMPGAGDRLIRAMICNPIEMSYSFSEPGYINCKARKTETIGFYMTHAKYISNYIKEGIPSTEIQSE